MRSKFLLLYSWLIRTLLYFLPDMPVTMRFRGFLYGLGMKSCGRNFQVTSDAWLKNIENIEIGDNCFIGNGSILMGSGKIIIEDKVLIGPHCILISGNHTLANDNYRDGRGEAGIIKIGKGSWVAANCTIAKGAMLAASSVLAANSMLNKQYDEAFTIYGGVPAKPIKTISH